MKSPHPQPRARHSPREGSDLNGARWEGRAKVTSEMRRRLRRLSMVEGSGLSLGLGLCPLPSTCAWKSLAFTSPQRESDQGLNVSDGAPDTQAPSGSVASSRPSSMAPSC